MGDPVASVETAAPQVDRLLVGEFEEQVGYHTVRSRGTTDWLLVHTLGGAGSFTVEKNADPAVASVGTVTLLPPGVPHDYRVAEGHDRWHLVFAHFHPGNEWRDLLDWPEVMPRVRQLSLPRTVSDRVAARLREAIASAATLHRHGERLAANALESALLWCDSRREPTAADDRVIRAAEYVDAHLADELTVMTLARHVGLSTSRLTHLFAAQWDVSPQRFIEQRRMAMAQRLLELTHRPVSSIAAEVGYVDPLYFSTRFRRHTGSSPTAFRARREA